MTGVIIDKTNGSNSDRHIARTISVILSWSREREYRGHSKHDALNSRLLEKCTLNIPFLRLAAIQAIMRFPFNMRSVLGVPKLRNPKGIGLFAHAYLDLAPFADIASGFDFPKDVCLAEADKLLTWLIHNSSPWSTPSPKLLKAFPPPSQSPETSRSRDKHLSGLGWGYHYPWQDAGFFQPRHFPNRVVSSWIGFAFVKAYETTAERRYLDAAYEIVDFTLKNPKILFESDEQLCLSYVPVNNIKMAVMDVSALVAALTMKVAYHLKEAGTPAKSLEHDAQRLMRFVVDKQTDYGAWYYTWPSHDSHITHDNYHTGIILDCLADFMKYSNDYSFAGAYESGLAFYREQLFSESGAPKWMSNKTYPFDIHGAASGIMTFSRAAIYFSREAETTNQQTSAQYEQIAGRIVTWTLENMYDSDGFFYYQKGRFLTKRFNLMRWCNAWMARALAQYMTISSQQSV